jgi:hypothetical protein
MKLNLLIASPLNLPDFINVNPLANPQDTSQVQGDVSNLDWLCDSGEVDELVVQHILDYFPMSATDSMLSGWLAKLSKNGIITLLGQDLTLLAKEFVARRISIEDYCAALYGFQQQPWQFKKSGLTLTQITEVLKSRGYKILEAKIENVQYTIRAQR